jgi:hypothetical protein
MTNEEWKRAEMLGNVMDQLWANALRAPGQSAKPEPVSRLRHTATAPFRVIEGGRHDG